MGKIADPTPVIIVRNPQFTADAEWLKTHNWTIAGGKAHCNIVGPPGGSLSQINHDFKAFTYYILHFTLSNVSFANPDHGLRVGIPTESYPDLFKTNGVKEAVIVTPLDSPQFFFTIGPATAGDTLSLDDVSITLPSGEVITNLGIEWAGDKRFEYRRGVAIDNVATIAARNGKTNCLIGYND